MFPFEYIDPLIFLIAFCVGLLYVYITLPQPQVVIKYPTPFNAGIITYSDRNGVCYQYHIHQTDCPMDSSKIKTYKVQ